MPDQPRRKGRPKSFNPDSSQTTIQSLDRALSVLECVAAHNGLTLTEIASELDQSAATVYRVLSTMQARGIVETEQASQVWQIGPMAFRLGSAFLRRSSVIERSRPVMRELMEVTGETSNLGIEKGGEVMFVSQVETHETIRAFFPPGTLSPMHASGIGKALLSHLEHEPLERFLRGRRFERFTDKTICDAEAIRSEVARIRDRGFAFDDCEKTKGMRCVAAAITNIHGEAVAGISVSGPSHRLPPERIAQIGARVRAAAAAVSASLGGSG